MFFEYYTENLWGRHPSEIDASWGKQRTKGLSIFGIIKDYLEKLLNIKNRKVNTSLIEEFKYPKYGPGQMWEATGEKILKMGGKIMKNARKQFHSAFGHFACCVLPVFSFCIKNLLTAGGARGCNDSRNSI